jgi:hypothetical protein
MCAALQTELSRSLCDGLYTCPCAYVQYAQLQRQGKEKEEQSKLSSPSKEDIFETELAAFHRQKKALSDTIPSDQKHLLNGLLYYRVSSDC